MDKGLFFSLYSLFHHNTDPTALTYRINSKFLFSLVNAPSKFNLKDISERILSIVKTNTKGYKDSEISLTLTGGMDSRLILAALLRLGIKPNCFTYGNPLSGDVFFARKIAERYNLKYHNACSEQPDEKWYLKWVLETIKRDGGNSHLHRAHRTAAIAEHEQLFKPKLLFTGHMGGEGIRGLTYNNYFASPFFELVNEGFLNIGDAVDKVLDQYFIKLNNVRKEILIENISNLEWMKHSKEINKLFFLYDLVANIHHNQDLRIYRSYIPKVVPVYLDNSYLETLFASDFHFLAKRKGISGVLQNPYVYCKIIESLFPDLLEQQMVNGFKPSEYLRGLWYYIPVKMYRKQIRKSHFPPSFSYGAWFEKFIKVNAQHIDNEIWEFFDKKKYVDSLSNEKHQSDEGYWHKYSNPVFFNLIREYNLGKI